MHPIQFLAFLVYTAVTVFALLRPEFLWFPAAFVFVGVPVLDLVIGVDKANPNPSQEALWKQEKVWAPALYLYALTHFVVLGLGVSLALELSWGWELLLLALVVGLYTGGLGITVGHELCHKKETAPRLVANLLLSSVWYQHFAVEHVRGHHLLVSTPDDPASARFNENVYVFVVRSVVTSFLHALKIDAKAVWAGVAMSVFFTLTASVFSTSVLIFFLLQSVVAFVLLELVNYLEHYGLVRKLNPSGRYEKVTPIHSWNSAHKFSNLLLFNLQRHSDHHALAHLPYTVLKHHEQAPQLPSGYPGMILLALVPPMWFKVMNPKVKVWETQTSTSA